MLRGRPELKPWLLVSVGILMLLLTGLVISDYIRERLWEPQWYFRDGDSLRKISKDQLHIFGKEALGPYLERVTLRVQKSTDALIPLAVIAGFVVFVFHRRWLGWVSLVGAACALVAVLMTYTRSMLLSMGVLLIGTLFWLAWVHRERFMRALAGTTLLALIGVTTIITFNMEGVYFHRMLMLLRTSKVLSSEAINHISDKWSSGPTAVPIPREDPYEKDANVLTRVEEYKIAWRLFLESPILGKGLGVKHDLEFETSSGQALKQRVGYIHNWPLYALMTGGLVGLVLYTFMLIGPIQSVLRHPSQETTVNALLVWSIVLLAVYGLYFAVFRLISFNLLLAVTWGLALAARYPD
jgi:O-antigen ligase